MKRKFCVGKLINDVHIIAIAVNDGRSNECINNEYCNLLVRINGILIFLVLEFIKVN